MNEFELELINRIRENELLYNPRARSYKHILKRDEAWRQIAADLDTPVEKCRQRWKSLRDRYVREKKIIEDPTSIHAQSNFEPWELYSQMEFLNESLMPKRPSGNYDEELPSALLDESSSQMQKDVIFEEYLINEVPTTSSESAPKRPRTREYQPPYPAADFFANLSKVFAERFSTPESEDDDLFLKMIAKKMKMLPEARKMRLQERIFQMVNAEVVTFHKP